MDGLKFPSAFVFASGLSAGLEARLYGRQGCPPLHPIRDVIAFPNTAKGVDLMTEAPGIAEPKQLRDLHLESKVKQSVATPPTVPKA